MTIILALILLILLSMTLPATIWEDTDLWGAQHEDNRECEHQRRGEFVWQPKNALSNFAFFVWALVIFFLGLSDLLYNYQTREELQQPSHPSRSNHILRNPRWSLYFALIYGYIGAGSFLYHSGYTERSSSLDMSAIYSCMMLFVIFASFRFVPTTLYEHKKTLSLTLDVLTELSVIIVCGIVCWYTEPKIDTFMAVYVCIGLLIVLVVLQGLFYRRTKTQTWSLLLAAISFTALAYLMWVGDRYGWLCQPHGFVQGHALWHVFVSVGIFLVYLFCRGEQALVGASKSQFEVVDVVDVVVDKGDESKSERV